jgi:NADH-quinone oxidoreductase subunit F
MMVPAILEQQIDEIITHYPPEHKRAAALWLLHLLQEHFGFLANEHLEWCASKLSVPPIDMLELVTFYPMFTQNLRGKFHVKVCRTLSCHNRGAQAVISELEKKLGIQLDETSADGRFTISTVECLADCGNAPVMMINDKHFRNVDSSKIELLVTELKSDRIAEEPTPKPAPAHARETRLLLGNCSRPDYTGSLTDYRQAGGYEALKKAFTQKPEVLVEEIINSKLRGRGGAGFPTGMKWKFVDRKSGKPVYLVCNADESEPGTFKDRVLLHQDPHKLLEGILISCYALQAQTAYIYVRGEFPDAATILLREIEAARAQNLVGKNILGSGFDCEIYLHRGAGAYICGEETGLIESLEGKRPYPRIKPPFPAVYGLFGCPTVVNNVETLCNIPQIIEKGAAWFAGLGVQGSAGTRIVCVSGQVAKPGYFEIEMGKITFGELINDLCGGLLPGRTLKGVIPGGSSMPVLLPDKMDLTLDFDTIQKNGSYFGSGGIIVLDNTCSIVDTALNLAQFYAHESCGQCTPCREGTAWMEKTLLRIVSHQKAGKNCKKDTDLLYNIADNIDGKTICALGEASAWPVKAFVSKFRSEFDAGENP